MYLVTFVLATLFNSFSGYKTLRGTRNCTSYLLQRKHSTHLRICLSCTRCCVYVKVGLAQVIVVTLIGVMHVFDCKATVNTNQTHQLLRVLQLIWIHIEPAYQSIASRRKGIGNEITCAISYILKNADYPCYSTKDLNSTYGERF